MIDIRPAEPRDTDFMWEMLFYASHSHDEPGVTLADIKQNPDLTRHLAGWGREGDAGLIADRSGTPMGACWLRRFLPAESDDVSYYDLDTPELVIAVDPDATGHGIGTQLLIAMLDLADTTHVPRIVLTARAANPAIALYERHGFDTIERITNRVGTESVKMLRASPTP